MSHPAVARGALPLALHPVMTLTGRPDDIDRLEGISFGVTAPDQLQPVAEALVIEMGGEPVLIREEDRGAVSRRAGQRGESSRRAGRRVRGLLRSVGCADPARMLGPLLYAALDNALRLGDAGLSGPVARGDADAVARHIEVLGQASPRALGAYLALARLTAGRALDAGLLASSTHGDCWTCWPTRPRRRAGGPGGPDERRDPGDGLGRGDGRDPGDGRDRGQGRDGASRPGEPAARPDQDRPRQRARATCPRPWSWSPRWERCTPGTGRCCGEP